MRFKLSLYSILLLIFFICCTERCAYAANYSYSLGQFYSGYGAYTYAVSSINLMGFNVSQGFAQQVPADVTMSYSSGNGGIYYGYLNYTLPDDGSYWRVIGSVSIGVFYSPPADYIPQYNGDRYFKVDTSNNTPGSYSGYSPKTATDTAGTAATNATAAMNAANAANTNALNASNYAAEARNEIRFGSYNGGKSLGATWDQALAANLNASNAASRTWDTFSSKSVATLARETMNNTPVIISKVQGVNQATCTSGTSFTAVVSISPSNNISYSVSCAGPVTPTISVSGNNITLNNLTAAGAYTATITATNTVTGGTAQTTFVFFKV